jgi:hypothetical protein
MAKVRFHSPPAREVKRLNVRWDRQRPITRGGASDHSGGGGGAVPATGATAGIPGTWTPPGSTPPATVAALQGGTPNVVVATPTTGWTTGQYVQTATAGAAGEATWTGTGWVGGRSIAGDDPATMTINQVEIFIDQHPDLAESFLAQERTGLQRVTLIAWLEGFIEHRDGPDQ